MKFCDLSENTKAKVKLTGSRYSKDGVEYVKIDTVNFSAKPSKLLVRFDNLFNGQKMLEDVANQVINQNIQIIQDSVLPEIEKGFEKKILFSANQVFEKAPANEFFP